MRRQQRILIFGITSVDLEYLLELPNLPQLMEQAQAALTEESRQREQFYNDIDEAVKAEFINGQVIALR